MTERKDVTEKVQHLHDEVDARTSELHAVVQRLVDSSEDAQRAAGALGREARRRSFSPRNMPKP